MTDNLLSAEELDEALENVCSPVYEDRKRARAALSDHIAALSRARDEARAQALEEAAVFADRMADESMHAFGARAAREQAMAVAIADAIRAAKDLSDEAGDSAPP